MEDVLINRLENAFSVSLSRSLFYVYNLNSLRLLVERNKEDITPWPLGNCNDCFFAIWLTLEIIRRG